jgi:hypothetical protein
MMRVWRAARLAPVGDYSIKSRYANAFVRIDNADFV